MGRLRLLLVLSGALALVMAPSAAHAAPAYVTSDPENHEELDEAPSEVRVVFDTPLDPASTMYVVDQCNDRVDDGSVIVAGNSIQVGISETPKGPYFVYWKVRAPGGVGGGDALGKITFHVESGEYCGPPSERVNGDGHDGHGGGGGKGNGGGGKHDGHGGGKDNEGKGGGSRHSGHDTGGSSGGSGSTSHNGHSATGGSHASSGTASGHTVHGTKDKGGAAKGGPHAGHAAADTPLAAPQQPQILANSEDLVPAVTGSTVLLALLASVVLGAGGGLLIRNLGPA